MKGSLSNQEEAFGVSIIEAMGAGLPVVTGESGGIKETVIPNKTGFLFTPGDVKAHAQYLIKLAENHVMRARMGKNAYQHVLENFTLENEKKTLLKILRTNE
jgi:glycosyltransferase involved in cell wall biosynthesis